MNGPDFLPSNSFPKRKGDDMDEITAAIERQVRRINEKPEVIEIRRRLAAEAAKHGIEEPTHSSFSLNTKKSSFVQSQAASRASEAPKAKSSVLRSTSVQRDFFHEPTEAPELIRDKNGDWIQKGE